MFGTCRFQVNDAVIMPDPPFDLKKVDKTNKKYTDYAYLRSRHGVCGNVMEKFALWEEDVLVEDTLADWYNVNFSFCSDLTLTAQGEAKLRVVETTEDVDP